MEKQYQVICQKCDGQRLVEITDTIAGKRIDWLENKQKEPYTIISGRQRLDNYLGWQCKCGNNSLVTKQENTSIADMSAPKPQEINNITKNLEKVKVVLSGNDIIIDNFILKAS